MSERIYISVSLEPDEDWPVADVIYEGTQWASVTLRDGELEVTVYGGPRSGIRIPLDDALASLERAQRQLRDIIGNEATGAS